MARKSHLTFSVPDWVANAIFYQIFLDRFANGDPNNDPAGVVQWESNPTRENFFGGDLLGTLNHLSWLEKLGVTALYLTPIFKANTNHKYDTCDYFTIDPTFGTKEILISLIDQAHKRGIRVILDAVFNHCGDGFWAFKDVMEKGADSRYAHWFIVNDYPISQHPPNYQTAGCTAYLPKLNTTNPEVRAYLLKVASYWIEEFDIDGWRLDIPWKIPLDFWQEFRHRVKQVKPDAYIVGEVWRNPIPWLQGDTCDGVMNYPLRNYILDYCVNGAMDAEDFNYEINLQQQTFGRMVYQQLNLLGSHDTPRILTLCNEDPQRALLAMTFQFTYLGAPMIYYGDEVGLTGGNDPDCRKCMPWDESKWNSQILEFYRRLIRTRHAHPALRRGGFEPLLVFNGIYAYRRSLGDDEVIVVLNPREDRHHIRIPLGNLAKTKTLWHDIISDGSYPESDGYLHIESLSSKGVLVLIPERSSASREE